MAGSAAVRETGTLAWPEKGAWSCCKIWYVPCEGFRVNAPYVAANGMGPMNKGGIVVAVLQ